MASGQITARRRTPIRYKARGSSRLRYVGAAGAHRSPLGALPGILLQSRAERAPHVHVDRDEASAKFWIEPVSLAQNLGFPARELTRLEALIADHQDTLLEAWNGYFGT